MKIFKNIYFVMGAVAISIAVEIQPLARDVSSLEERLGSELEPSGERTVEEKVRQKKSEISQRNAPLQSVRELKFYNKSLKSDAATLSSKLAKEIKKAQKQLKEGLGTKNYDVYDIQKRISILNDQKQKVDVIKGLATDLETETDNVLSIPLQKGIKRIDVEQYHLAAYRIRALLIKLRNAINSFPEVLKTSSLFTSLKRTEESASHVVEEESFASKEQEKGKEPIKESEEQIPDKEKQYLMEHVEAFNKKFNPIEEKIQQDMRENTNADQSNGRYLKYLLLSSPEKLQSDMQKLIKKYDVFNDSLLLKTYREEYLQREKNRAFKQFIKKNSNLKEHVISDLKKSLNIRDVNEKQMEKDRLELSEQRKEILELQEKLKKQGINFEEPGEESDKDFRFTYSLID